MQMRRMWISAMLVGGVALSAVSGGWAQDATGEAAKPQMMAKDADPNIEVASVRASDPNDTKEHFGMIGRHLVIEREPVEVLLRVGFGVQKSQIANVPEWARTELFNVDAVPDMPGDPDLEQT